MAATQWGPRGFPGAVSSFSGGGFRILKTPCFAQKTPQSVAPIHLGNWGNLHHFSQLTLLG